VTAALYATIWIALAGFVAGEAGKHRPAMARWAWPMSLAGALFCIVHIVIAMGSHHQWSHEAAVTATAQQTAAVYGLEWGGGVYVNYVFVAVWLGELWWWRARPGEYFMRSAAVRWGLRVFYFIIIVNAAVVFASPRSRPLGAVLTAVLVASWLHRIFARRNRM
jgi:hypothetical protein